MSNAEELKELYDLARRALECQAAIGHKEIILEPMASLPEIPVAVMPLPAIPPIQPTLLPNLTLTIAAPEYESLELHNQAICNCLNCPLGHTRTKFVYGVGNPHAKIMFVGEAPGRDEDLKGEPFVGRAGQLLNNILVAMKLTRQDVYIANILKCRPPENRDPQPDEMQACFPYLKEQIRLIKPQFLCALGRIAAHGLLNTTTPLGKLRSRWHSYEGIPMLVTYHPAALLRFPQYKRDVWEDMKFLMAEYERRNENK
jgi:DNA polymerase